MDIKNVKQIVIDICENVDEVMFENGFNRRKDSRVYSRKINNGKQRVEVVFSTHPLGQPNALAQIYPFLSVYFPDINNLAISVLGEDNDIIRGLPNLTLRQPFFIKGTNGYWYLFHESEKQGLSSQIANFFRVNVLPFLNSLTDIDTYLKMFEAQDKRLVMDDRQHIYFAFAYALKGEYRKGYNLLDKRFGTLTRRKNPTLFEYFEQRL